MFESSSIYLKIIKTPYNVDMPHHIKVFDILFGQFLTNARLFAVVTPGIPDEITTDTKGRVYFSSASGVKVYDQNANCLENFWLKV